MPYYDYRCTACQHTFTAKHSMNEQAPACPACGAPNPQRRILSAPQQLLGMLANAGDSRRSSKDQLRDKWAEETPKLRRKLVDKLGEDFVSKNAPTLNPNSDT